MRTALRIILCLIGNMVPRNACFDGWEEILQRREEGGTTHDPLANRVVYEYICDNRAREWRSSQRRFGRQEARCSIWFGLYSWGS